MKSALALFGMILVIVIWLFFSLLALGGVCLLGIKLFRWVFVT